MEASQMQALLDRNDITDLVSRLGLWLDEGRLDGSRSILTEDVTARTPGGEARGIERVAEQAQSNHARYEVTHHVFSNVLIVQEGDRATVRANALITLVTHADEPGPHEARGARYHLEAARTAHGWRFSQVEATNVWRYEPQASLQTPVVTPAGA